MARAVNVQVVTAHDDTDDALRSVLHKLKEAGYLYVDYAVHNPGTSKTELISGECHAQLIVGEPECDEAGKLPLPGAKEDPLA